MLNSLLIALTLKMMNKTVNLSSTKRFTIPEDQPLEKELQSLKEMLLQMLQKGPILTQRVN